MKRLYHTTLTTGEVRWSARDEVHDGALAELAALLAECGRQGFAEFPSPSGLMLLRQLAPANPSRNVACWTVSEPGGPPLVTFGIALKSRSGESLWRQLHSVNEPGMSIATRADDLPPTPWLAARLHLPLMLSMGHAEWLGDFERSLAWAWIEGRK